LPSPGCRRVVFFGAARFVVFFIAARCVVFFDAVPARPDEATFFLAFSSGM
jgi:hypothetical protein